MAFHRHSTVSGSTPLKAPHPAMTMGSELLTHNSALVDSSPLQSETRFGRGHLHVSLVDKQSSAVVINAHAPLKLLVPSPRGSCVWAFASTFGGGLVAGDHIHLSARVEAGATLAIGTQASTKVYRSDEKLLASQKLDVQVHSGALFGVIPDPVTCFAGSNYQQQQHITLADDASLVLFDPLTSGRAARSERWAFTHYESLNHITRNGTCLMHDAMRLHHHNHRPLVERMGRFHALCTVVLLGPRCAHAAKTLLTWHRAQPVEKQADLLVSASPLADGAVLRLAANGYDVLEGFLRQHLGDAIRLFGDHWFRKP